MLVTRQDEPGCFQSKETCPPPRGHLGQAGASVPAMCLAPECLSIHPVYVSVHPSIHRSNLCIIYPSIHHIYHPSTYPLTHPTFQSIYLLSLYPPTHPSILSSIYHLSSIHPLTHLPTYPLISVCPSIYESIHPYIYVSIHPPIHPNIHLSYLSVHLSR